MAGPKRLSLLNKADLSKTDTYHGDKRDSRAQQGQILTMEASKVEKPQSQRMFLTAPLSHGSS